MNFILKFLKVNLMVVLAVLSIGCRQDGAEPLNASGSLSSDSSKLSEGTWGANEANFTVSDQGALLEMGCAIAQISGAINVNEIGEFKVEGIFQRQGGAEPIGGFRQIPAQFHGTVDGNSLTLIVSVNDSSEVSTLVLSFGVTGRLLRCL